MRNVFSVLQCAALACSIGSIFTALPSAANNENARPTVKTAEGPIQGYTDHGVSIFKGIPYAAPPVGELRWRPPQAVKRWKGTLDATQFGSNCPQVTTLGPFAGPTSTNEDCLYLNVFTTNKGSFAKKAVIVWIHGGGNYAGGSSDYDATKLATGGPDGVPTVVVTLNYRIGLFGIFAHPAINNEGHLWGNYNALDVQAVLRWVQRNISAFGGDPTRVALAGQSGGAANVGFQVVSPLSAGLFNRAITESSAAYIHSGEVAANALSRGQSFAAAAGCPGSDVAAAKCLRNLSAARILQLQGTAYVANSYVNRSVADGTILPTDQLVIQEGKFNKMPILGGTTRDEGTFNIGINEYFSGSPQVPMTADQYKARVTGDVAAQYPLSNYNNDPNSAYNRVTSDPTKCTELHSVQILAAQVPVYAYDFRYQTSPYYFPKMPGFTPLAAHTIDIQYLFMGYHGGNLGVNLDQQTGQPRELNAKETKLSDQLVAAWTNFAKTGNPNGSGDSPWPRFTSDNNAKYLVQDIPLSTATVSQLRNEYKCDFWDSKQN